MKPVNLRHPCYNKDLLDFVGRIHLPVANKCNMQCHYCSKNFACVNENRPGVCKEIISPEQVVEYIDKTLQKHPNIEVAGIAGPAEPMADLDIMRNTFELVKEHFPQLLLCMATNGLVLADNIDLILYLGIDYITITINSLQQEQVKQLYEWISFNGRYFKNDEVAEILIEQHKKALKAMYLHQINYKINTIFVPGINDNEIENISKTGSAYGAIAHNIIPLLPLQGSLFENRQPVKSEELAIVREKSSKYLKTIKHCKQCRADAAGLLTD